LLFIEANLELVELSNYRMQGKWAGMGNDLIDYYLIPRIA